MNAPFAPDDVLLKMALFTAFPRRTDTVHQFSSIVGNKMMHLHPTRDEHSWCHDIVPVAPLVHAQWRNREARHSSRGRQRTK